VTCPGKAGAFLNKLIEVKMEQFILEIQNLAEMATQTFDVKDSLLQLASSGTGKCKLYYI